jgi:hypothetical protein
MDKYEAARIVNPWGLTENINIQYYKPAPATSNGTPKESVS